MIGYLCKYAPIEVLESMGAQMELIMPEATDFNQADTAMHANICSFIKGVLETFSDGGYEGILLTNCCDSTRRLYDVLKKEYPQKFICLVDVPRAAGEDAASFFAESILRLAEEYGRFSGRVFSRKAFAALLSERMGEAKSSCETDTKETKACSACVTGEDAGSSRGASMGPDSAYEAGVRPESACGAGRIASPVKVGLMGARCSRDVLEMIESYNIHVVFDMTCTGIPRDFRIPEALLSEVQVSGSDAENAASDVEDIALEDIALNVESTVSDFSAGFSDGGDHLLTAYADQLLRQIPCMRMADCRPREEFLDSYRDRLDGIIFHTVKFCDNYAYEYAWLCGRTGIPIQKFETDATSQCQGQIRTRLEAFLESVAAAKGVKTLQVKKSDRRRKSEMGKKIRVLGIDSGSTSTNAVILGEDRRIEAYTVLRTGAKSGDSAERAMKEVLQKAALSREEIDLIVSTGYGRVSIPFADWNVTEISCHGKGAHYFNPGVRTVLDIGGQDSKAIRLDEKGDVVDFVMNDKCAAGTGRFLEMMARTLEIDIEQLGRESLEWKEDLDISSMCSVFAESEVISLIANNRERCDIAHGIHKAVANKSVSLMKRIGLQPAYMMTGGVAKNPGAVREIEEKLGEKLFICEEPEIVGAAGAALFGLEELLG